MFFPIYLMLQKVTEETRMKCRPFKPSRQQPEMKKKDTMNENIIYLLKYTLLFYEVMGRKTRFQVHAGSCPS